MEVFFTLLEEKDIIELVDPMTKAFDDDAKRFNGKEKDGPPGYDDGSFLYKWGLDNNGSISYKIIVDSKSVGAFIIWWNEDGESTLGTIFVDPELQNKGVGRKAWCFIEDKFLTKSWILDTPTWAVRNHHFYEKVCGFIKIGTKDDQVIYKKFYK
ncbi:MAG: GNAT family N-acetyltransferase [Desulfobacterales bacterium]|nr:GNAT family N-acetyltransferase [Desulfobacterales bacterium]MCP4161988.1 GNAT family N-acetyltransferase [Deltaproteobacteria bacterium]